MNWSLPTAVLALLISLASFCVALYNSLRDRPRLKVMSTYYEGSEWDPEPRFHIILVNTGRRPVILRMLGGHDDDGHWCATMLQSEKGGIRLGEHERHELSVKKDDTVEFIPEGDDVFYKEMWVEDSLGTRHAIPNSMEYIRRLWN